MKNIEVGMFFDSMFLFSIQYLSISLIKEYKNKTQNPYTGWLTDYS